MCNEMREADVNRKALLQMIADFVQKILPSNTSRTPPAFSDKSSSPLKQTVTTPPRSFDPDAHEIIYETPTSTRKTGVIKDKEEDDVGGADNDHTEPDVQDFGNKYFGKVASPYVMSYLYNSPSLDTDFGIRKDDDGDFRIGKSLIEIGENSEIFVDGKTYTGTPGLYELITRKKVSKSLITIRDLKNYRRILEVSSAHRKHNNHKGPIKTKGGEKFREVISQLFPATNKRAVETVLRRSWIRYK